jgi:sulfur-oxidizing protein SoxB
MLGVDIMTGHWEFTYGAERVMQLCAELQDRIEFLAQNVATSDFGDPVFSSVSMREQNGVQVAVIGQAFPYTPVANPAHFVPDWTFGLQEQRLQSNVEVARARGATVVVLLSHCGMDVDLKLAGRIRGLDAILGGHTHDAVPKPVVVPGPTGPCLVTNAGSNGKFLGVLDLITDKRGRVVNHSYKLLPVFASILPKEPEMERYIASVRRPYTNQLAEVLAVTDTLLYRRGNFGGTFDQVILDSMLATQDAQIAFSPGFRWGTTLLPGEQVTMEALMNQTAITYPSTMVTEMTGSTIKDTLEDVCDNLFNPDPYRQQGGDMVRTAGMTYACNPTAAIGERISDLRIKGVPMNADHRYKVASWAPVSKQAQELGGQPIWEIVATYLRDRKVIDARDPQWPKIEAVQGNPGLA